MSNGQRFIEYVAGSRKAIIAGAAVLIAVLTPQATDGVTIYEVLAALGAALASGGVTYAVPNVGPKAPPAK